MPVAGPIIGAVGSLAGGAMGASAAGDAANAQTQASRDQINATLAMYNQSRNDTMPYQATGVGALNRLAQMYGLPMQAFNPGGGISISGGEPAKKKKRTLFDKFTDPANLAGQFGGTSYDPMGFFGKPGQQLTPLSIQANGGTGGGSAGGGYSPGTGVADFSAFYQTPDYQVAMQEGLQGLNRLAASRGGFRSGRLDADTMRLASNIGSGAFSNFQNNLFRLAGFGGQANQQLNQLGSNASQQIGGALYNGGQARANAFLNQGNAWGNAWNGVGNAFGQWQANQNANPGIGPVVKQPIPYGG
jgi:hypothetical protein